MDWKLELKSMPTFEPYPEKRLLHPRAIRIYEVGVGRIALDVCTKEGVAHAELDIDNEVVTLLGELYCMVENHKES
jgi:hypothetical protein